MKLTKSQIAMWEARGFTVTPDMRVKCEQCEAISINGVARHETGCPNARHECKGCNELIPVGQRYYADCQ